MSRTSYKSIRCQQGRDHNGEDFRRIDIYSSAVLAPIHMAVRRSGNSFRPALSCIYAEVGPGSPFRNCYGLRKTTNAGLLRETENRTLAVYASLCPQS